MTAALPPTPHRLTPDVIRSEAQLRALLGEPAALTCAKITTG